MDKRYYTPAEIMEMFRIKQGNYTSYGNLCRRLKLPRIKIGKQVLHPIEDTEKRIDMVEKEKLKNYKVRVAA